MTVESITFATDLAMLPVQRSEHLDDSLTRTGEDVRRELAELRDAYARDTERLRQEAQRAAEAHARTLSVVSHELRGPLSVIKFATSLLLAAPVAEDDAAQKARRRLESIARGADQLVRVIDDILG